MSTYSQYGEDLHIKDVFKGQSTGRFLDLGAWNPITFSNTRLLWESGWTGVMVEPSPGPSMTLLKEYGNDERITLIQAAMGVEKNCVRLHVTDDAVSTTNDSQYLQWKDHAEYIGSLWVPTLTLPDLFNQFGGPFDFVNIDTEGLSVALFSDLLKTALFPQCVCLEHDGRSVEVQQMAQAKGYKTVHINGTNVIFAR